MENVTFEYLWYNCTALLQSFSFNYDWNIAVAIDGHAMLAFFGFSQSLPIVAMVLRAVAYAVIGCALWPLIAYLVSGVARFEVVVRPIFGRSIRTRGGCGASPPLSLPFAKREILRQQAHYGAI